MSRVRKGGVKKAACTVSLKFVQTAGKRTSKILFSPEIIIGGKSEKINYLGGKQNENEQDFFVDCTCVNNDYDVDSMWSDSRHRK